SVHPNCHRHHQPRYAHPVSTRPSRESSGGGSVENLLHYPQAADSGDHPCLANRRPGLSTRSSTGAPCPLFAATYRAVSAVLWTRLHGCTLMLRPSLVRASNMRQPLGIVWLRSSPTNPMGLFPQVTRETSGRPSLMPGSSLRARGKHGCTSSWRNPRPVSP